MSKPDGHDKAVQWFSAYLDDLGLQYEQEPNLAGKEPDFRVTGPAGHRVVCEVQTFARDSEIEKDVKAFRRGFSWASVDKVVKPIRGQIKEAANKLKALDEAGLGLPLVIVFADPLGLGVPLDPQFVCSAMYGGDEIGVPTNDPDGETTVTWQLGPNGKLRNDHAYISGALVLERRDDLAHKTSRRRHRRGAEPGVYYATTLIESISPDAVPVPEGIFAGPHDQRVPWDREW